MGKPSVGITVVMAGVAVIELLRETVVIHRFGTGAISDAYFLGVSIPMVLGGSLQTIGVQVVMPWFCLSAARDPEMTRLQMSRLFFVVLLPAVVLALLSRHLAPALGRAMGGPTIDQEMLVTALTLALPTLALMATSTVLASYLNARERYVGASLRRVFNSVCFIVITVITPRHWTTYGLGLAFLLGSVAELGWLVAMARPSIHDIASSTAASDWRGLRELASSTFLPMTAVLLGRAGTTAEHVMAGHLATGSVSILSYGYRAVMALARILAEGLVTVIRSQASSALGERAEEDGEAILSEGLRLVLSLLLPVSVMLIVLRRPIAQLLFAANKTDAGDLSNAAALLAIYACVLPTFGMGSLFMTPFYAQGNTTTPALHGMLMLGLNLGLDLVAIRSLGLLGIPVARVIIAVVSIVRARWLVGRIGVSLPAWQDTRFATRLVVGALGAGLAGQTVFTWLSPLTPIGILGTLLAVALAALTVVLVYVVIEAVVGMQEFRHGVRWLWRTVVGAWSR
jgi:putative peptidoglycan lipid II flippase